MKKQGQHLFLIAMQPIMKLYLKTASREFFSFTAFSAAQKRNLKTVRLFSTFAVSRENIGSILVSKNKEINLLKNQFLLKAVTGLICGKIPLVTSNILTEITDVTPDLNLVFTICSAIGGFETFCFVHYAWWNE